MLCLLLLLLHPFLGPLLFADGAEGKIPSIWSQQGLLMLQVPLPDLPDTVLFAISEIEAIALSALLLTSAV